MEERENKCKYPLLIFENIEIRGDTCPYLKSIIRWRIESRKFEGKNNLSLGLNCCKNGASNL